MPSRKKNVAAWLGRRDRELLDAIGDACMAAAIEPPRGGSVTFVLPSAEDREAIIDAAYDGNTEDAVELVNAHSLSRALGTAADWARAPVGTRAGFALAVKSTKGKTVTLTNGARLRLEKAIGSSAAVWSVVEGAMPREGAEFKAARRRRPRRPKKSAAKALPDIAARGRLAAAVEEAFGRWMRGAGGLDPYLTAAVSLLNFLRGRHPEVYAAVVWFVDLEPATTFYLLVEPYKMKGTDYLIKDEVLFGEAGWNGARVFADAAGEYLGVFESLARLPAEATRGKRTARALAAEAPEKVLTAIDEIRCNISGADSDPKKTPKNIKKFYANLKANNAVSGQSPILPDAALALVTADKLDWMNQLRWVIDGTLSPIRGSRAFYDPADFREFVQTLQFHYPGNNYAREARLSDMRTISSSVSSREPYAAMCRYVASTSFGYFPCSNEVVARAHSQGEIPESLVQGDPEDEGVFNPAPVKTARLRRAGAAQSALGAGERERLLHLARSGVLPESFLAELGAAGAPADPSSGGGGAAAAEGADN